jgi:toxin YoeB
LEFAPDAFEDLAWWITKDRAKAIRIIRLIREVLRDPFEGLGKPEPLKHGLTSAWSRRIDSEHRPVYQILETKIRIVACRYHY